MPRETNIQIRRGTANDWASVNPTLASGEMAIENDTRKVKVGDGTTAWNELRYIGADGGDLDGAGGGSPSPTATPATPTPTPTPTSSGPGFLVQGAGTEGANGTYCLSSGDANNYGIFVNTTNQYSGQNVYLYTSGLYNGWVISITPNDSDVPLYLASGNFDPTPPLTGWSTGTGDPSAPTLSSTSC